jgi:4-amino-4-deoxy-L-arabinose transferase-like glycosyltransferase
LGIVLPGLVIASFLALRRRWDLFAKFCFHPGVIITLLLAVGWYGLAATRGGESFVDRQLLRENLERFFGGSGHSHPVYYYISYLFAQGLLWSLFLPFLFWDSFKQGFGSNEDRLFLWLWFSAMFVFFSVSLGKRPVYLLPLYPALALLIGVWFHQTKEVTGAGRIICRAGSFVAGLTALLIFAVALGALWNHDPGWLFSPIEAALKDKDRANLLVVKNALENFGWTFTGAAFLSGILWLSLAHSLWQGRLKPAAHRLVFISILLTFMAHGVVDPAIAESKSYRAFMEEVNRRVQPGDKLYTLGGFNDDPVVFYRGGLIDELEPSPEAIAKLGPGKAYVIVARRIWEKLQRQNPNLPPPLVESVGAGPEGDAPLVLVEVS